MENMYQGGRKERQVSNTNLTDMVIRFHSWVMAA